MAGRSRSREEVRQMDGSKFDDTTRRAYDRGAEVWLDTGPNGFGTLDGDTPHGDRVRVPKDETSSASRTRSASSRRTKEQTGGRPDAEPAAAPFSVGASRVGAWDSTDRPGDAPP